MIRWHLRIALLVLLMCGAVLFLIRAQPSDAYQNRQPFIQDDCAASCFVGIQPGVTTVDEALIRLEASGWASAIDNRTINNVSGFISWDWSDQKPDWISRKTQGKIWATQKQVVQILIYGDLQLGATRLALGLPDQEVIDRSADRKGEFSLYTATYGQTGLMIQTWQPCNVIEPLRRPVILTYIMPANPRLFPARDSLADLHHTCPFHRR